MFEGLAKFIKDLFKSLIDFFIELPINILDGILSGILAVINSVPVPDFVVDNQVGDYITDEVAWMLSTSGFNDAMAIIGASMIFRFLRRVLTLGIW